MRTQIAESFAFLFTPTLFTVTLFQAKTVHALEKLKHGAKLSQAGLGSDLELMVPIDNPFVSSGSLKIVEAMPDRRDETLSTEPVPPELKSHDSAGQFYLPSSLLQVRKSPGESLDLALEYREVDFLNKLVDGRIASNLLEGAVSRDVGDTPAIHRNRDPIAVMDALAYDGPSWVDFKGPCGLGYSPFTKLGGKSLDECWSSCREYRACTQVHFDQEAQSCYLSQGISTSTASFVELISGIHAECRSLTFAGVKALYGLGLPPFRILADTQLYLVSNTSVSNHLALSLAECQSACLEAEACHFGAWVDGNNACYLGQAISNKYGLNDYVKVGGDEKTILFERNLANMVSVKNQIGVPASTLLLPHQNNVTFPGSQSCEKKCGKDLDSESACVVLCLVEARSSCEMNCLRNVGSGADKCIGVALFYGNKTDQTCVGFSSLPQSVQSAGSLNHRFVDVYVMPAEAVASPGSLSSLLEGSPSGGASMVPNFSQFNGGCNLFHEGVLMGAGPGISQFTAQSISECWNLCMLLGNNGCSQIQYNSATSLCVLGDAIATSYVQTTSTSSVQCRTLNAPNATISNGLSGMLFVDSVGDQGRNVSRWFSGSAQPVLVESLIACQAMCKVADTGAKDSVCRYGGFAPCASFFSSVCGGAQASSLPDCALCQGNTQQGICRIPQINSAQPFSPTYSTSSSSTSTSTSTSSTPVIPCLGGKCTWFEKAAVGFSMLVSTQANPAQSINFLPRQAREGLFCDSTNYLPSPVKDATGMSACSYPAESLWHCQQMCNLVNQNNGTVGIPSCIAGLYTDKGGSKQCRLAKYRLTVGKPCPSGMNCAWFELNGEGRTATLLQTGMNLADQGRQQPLPFVIGRGACEQFRAMQPVLTNTPKGFQFSPIEDCTRACMYFPQCSSFQLTGSLSGTSNSSSCDVVPGTDSNCTFVTCALSTAISVPTPTSDLNTLCWTRTPMGLTDQGDAAIDMDGMDPGLPGFTTTNARVRKFGWDSVINKNGLILTPSLEECQSTCRVSDACIAGSWQPCQSIETYCLAASQPGASQELIATCNACRNVNLSPAQPSVQFPANLGVCKQASVVGMVTQGCSPEPCYTFEEGGENYVILSMSKSPLIGPGGSFLDGLVSFRGEPRAFIRTHSVVDCETLCTQDPTCKYGHFESFSNGYGKCYLTNQEIRVTDGSTYRLKMPNPCSGACIVFMKLPTTLPASMGR